MKKIIGLLLLLLSITFLMAQKKAKPIDQHIVFEAEMTNNIRSNTNKKQRLLINISTFGSNLSIAPCDIYDLDIYEKPIKIDMPSKTNFTYLTLEIEGVLSRRGIDNVYILEKGDSVRMKVYENSYHFYGKGADKLNCQSEMYDIQDKGSESESKLLNQKDYGEYLKISNTRKDSILKKQLEIVDKYASRLGKQMTEIMLANAYGNRYSPTLKSYIALTRSVFPDLLPFVLKSEAYKNLDMSSVKLINPFALIASPIYCNFLIEKITADNAIETNSNEVRSKSEMPHLVFETIKTKYQGLIRDKLFALFFLKYKKNPESFQYLDEAIQNVEDLETKTILIDMQKTNTKGAAFFPFELEAVSGSKIRLADLDGKVIILDFWYTGCENCIILHEGMKPVKDKFKDNPKVEFVSVSVDRDKITWLKSVASGKYTDPEGLNLYTNGLGYKHPLIEKYYIRGYPTVFLLKNGKIITVAPPIPGPSLTKESHIKARAAFISLIEETLNDHSFLP